jgi:sigma-B regulation protein RsbU (phosphoserine phosphatase)
LQIYIKNLQDTTAQQEKMESELKIANNIQQQMLPKPQEIPGREGISYYGLLKPARQVGGDLYDFLIRDNFLYFAVGDVSGKGIPAALFMAKTLTLFRAKVSGGKDPGDLSAEINHELEKYNEESMFVTFFIGKLNLNTGELLYTNAGHNLPYLVDRNAGVGSLKGTHGLPLGSFGAQEYKQESFQFRKGEKIVLFTDGIPEATNIDNSLYGEAKMELVITEKAKTSPREIADALIADVESFVDGAEQSDDITLFILEYN